MENEKAVVIFSGGQDSMTCLAWALKKFKEVETITFNYNQRHKIEIQCAKKFCIDNNIKHFVYDIDVLKWNKNALTDGDIDVKETDTVPTTFVPYRNAHFLLIASTYAKSIGANHLITGVCQTDFSGYFDCRNVFIKSFEKMINEADDYKLKIHTPLMWLNKCETVKLMQSLKKIEWYAYTHTCYEGNRPACGKCPACKLRLKGFDEAKIKDPIEYEHNN